MVVGIVEMDIKMDPKLSAKQLNYLTKTLNDLKIQALLFDMDIDYETLTLTEKNTYKEPDWLRRWKEKVYADYNPYFDNRD